MLIYNKQKQNHEDNDKETPEMLSKIVVKDAKL